MDLKFKTIQNRKLFYIKYSAVSLEKHSAHSTNVQLNRWVLSLDLNVANVLAYLISSGSWFQRWAAY